MFSKWVWFTRIFVCAISAFPAMAAEIITATNPNPPKVAAASGEAQRALNRFRLQKGHWAELVAAEPLLANPVAFTIDERGRFFVAETFRLHDGVTDIRSHMSWLTNELASTSVEDRVAYMKRYESNRISRYTQQSDRLRILWDNDGDGLPELSKVYADGFNEIADGLGAGVLSYRGTVYYANIPHLWVLRDEDRNNEADSKRSMHYGFGVRVGFLGHDLHGLKIGPDGKLYFSVGDRGANVVTKERKSLLNLEEGVVYRCDLNGLNLEVFARGLRNPQELAFDEFGNLWTGDNNSDGGDPARWVYLMEGSDSGWRVGYQFITSPPRGPWLAERMCYPHWEGQPAFIVPPIANIGNGPSGLTYYPGIGLLPRYQGHFFLADFRGTTGSGIHSFGVRPRGAGFEVVDRHDFIWEVLVTDCEFGYDGNLYLTDWVEGWRTTGKGRIYRVYDLLERKNPILNQTKKLVERGIYTLPVHELVKLLSHPDMRVRQEAQLSIVEKGPADSFRAFTSILRNGTNRFARIHSIWGLGQIARKSQMAVTTLNTALRDKDPEIRAQSARALGDCQSGDTKELVRLLGDESARVRSFAMQALGKLAQLDAMNPIAEVLRLDGGRDPYLRHAGVMAFHHIMSATNRESLTVAADKHEKFEKLCADESDAVRMTALLTLRRLESPEISRFLRDENPLLIAEAARAINDLPITNALPALAVLANDAEPLLELPVGDVTHPGPRDAVLLRVLNANYRVGLSNNAAALAKFAANSKAPEPSRVQALAMLRDWQQPSGRDAVTGLWRPLPSRQPSIAAAALQPVLKLLEESPSEAIKVAATRAAGTLHLEDAGFDAYGLATDTDSPANVRVEALRSLAANNDPRLEEALTISLQDTNEIVRREAITTLAQVAPEAGLSEIRKIIEVGTIPEKQSALAALGTVPGPDADSLILNWLNGLLGGKVAPELHLDLLSAAGKRTDIAVKETLEKFERLRPAADDLRSYRECLAGGNIEEGRKVFFERPEASCVRCHKIKGEGGETGPDLSTVGAKQTREYILESIVYPNKVVAKGFETVVVSLRTGGSHGGVIKSETAETIDIEVPDEGTVRVRKADIQSRERGLSGMPEELRQVLTKQDMRNLVEFLSSLTAPVIVPVAPAQPAPPKAE